MDIDIPTKKNGERSKFQIELDKYISEPAKQTDAIEFWRTNAQTYPCLFYCAKTILSIPASSVPSESVFSDTSQQVSAKRNRISPEKVNKIMVISEFYS